MFTTLFGLLQRTREQSRVGVLTMGAAASIEALKPADASDITETGELAVAKGEVIRLREALGAFAKDAGFAEITVNDASDLAKGENEKEDFDRCVAEVVHIRAALRLSTAAGKRRERNRAPTSFFDTGSDGDEMASTSSGSSDEGEPEPAKPVKPEKDEAKA